MNVREEFEAIKENYEAVKDEIGEAQCCDFNSTHIQLYGCRADFSDFIQWTKGAEGDDSVHYHAILNGVALSVVEDKPQPAEEGGE